MDSSWGWLEPRSDELWARQFGNGFGGNNNNGNDDDSNNSNNGNGFNNNGTGNGFRGFGGRNQTNTIINQFRFQAAKSIRTSTIILSVFNVVAAAATAVGILWDGYATAKRNDPKYKFRTSAFNCVGPAEAFPLILSCGIVIQGIVFAVAQSTGLRNEQVLGCTIVSQMMLPGGLDPLYHFLLLSLFRSAATNYSEYQNLWGLCDEKGEEIALLVFYCGKSGRGRRTQAR